MTLIENMNKYVWNDYYVFLASSLFPQMAIRLEPHAPWYVVEILASLGIASLATYSWMEKKKK